MIRDLAKPPRASTGNPDDEVTKDEIVIPSQDNSETESQNLPHNQSTELTDESIASHEEFMDDVPSDDMNLNSLLTTQH